MESPALDGDSEDDDPLAGLTADGLFDDNDNDDEASESRPPIRPRRDLAFPTLSTNATVATVLHSLVAMRKSKLSWNTVGIRLARTFGTRRWSSRMLSIDRVFWATTTRN